MAELILNATVQTARIPELTEQPDPLTLSDRIPVWIALENKTRQASLAMLKAAMEGATGTPVTPSVSGNELIYVVPDDITADTFSVSIPEIAGKNFSMERGGWPVLPTTEYEVLDVGGFNLVGGSNSLQPGERFKLTLYTAIGGGGVIVGGGTSSAGSLFTGTLEISTNITIGPSQVNKLMQIRTEGIIAPITVTLASVADFPANTILVFETDVNGERSTKITTTSGQKIYMGLASRDYVHIRFGEALWLYCGTDGWYVINNFGKIYEGLGQPKAAYKVGINQFLCDGSVKSRAAEPRLWDLANSLGASLVDDATWNTTSATVAGRTVPKPYRGCWSTGDGSTTFRIPDLMNVALRGIKSISGSDTERHLNKAGGFQLHEANAHSHGLGNFLQDTDGGDQPNTLYLGSDHGAVPNSSGFTGSYGGAETRMDNVGVLWVIDV